MATLEVRDLHVWFSLEHGGELHAVRGIDLEVDQGDRVGLVGESGCGKTTAMLALMGLLPALASVAGEVLLDGENILELGEETASPHRWRDIAMVFQGAMNAFNPVKRIADQIVEPMELHGVAEGKDARRRAEDLLEMVGIDRARADRYPHEFSGGMRQRAVIAMALACNPRVLLADEPTTALDVIVQAQVLELLVSLSDDLGLALLLVTHDLPIVVETCSRAAVMRDGEIVETGAVGQLVTNPRHEYTRFLFESTPDLIASEQPRSESAGQEILEVDDLVTRFPVPRGIVGWLRREPQRNVRAVENVSFTLAEGELVALVGESGSGKTTTAQTVMRLIDPMSGSIRFRGDDITRLDGKELRSLRRRIQIIYQDPYESLDPRFRVRQTVEEPLLIHGLGSKEERAAKVLDALERAGLTPPEQFLDRYPHQLSGGQRQRVAIAAGLVLGPELLVADEPVSMLDVSIRAEILALLDGLRRSGMAILMITHDLSTAANYADRIAVMYEGSIVEVGSAYEIIHNPQHEYTKALIAAVPTIDRRIEPSGPPIASPAPAT